MPPGHEFVYMRYSSLDGIDAEAGAAKNTDSAQSRRARRARISRPKKDDAAENEREKYPKTHCSPQEKRGAPLARRAPTKRELYRTR